MVLKEVFEDVLQFQTLPTLWSWNLLVMKLEPKYTLEEAPYP